MKMGALSFIVEHYLTRNSFVGFLRMVKKEEKQICDVKRVEESMS
jgi:hypothetical protein